MELETVALATYLAVMKFNDGDISFLRIFEDLDITPSVFTCKGAQGCNATRVKLSAKKCTEKVKVRRKTLRHLRKSYIDSTEANEGTTYEAGSF